MEDGARCKIVLKEACTNKLTEKPHPEQPREPYTRATRAQLSQRMHELKPLSAAEYAAVRHALRIALPLPEWLCCYRCGSRSLQTEPEAEPAGRESLQLRCTTCGSAELAYPLQPYKFNYNEL
jgi:hypothetical protein